MLLVLYFCFSIPFFLRYKPKKKKCITKQSTPCSLWRISPSPLLQGRLTAFPPQPLQPTCPRAPPVIQLMSAADTMADQLLTINTAPLQGALQAKCLQATGPQAPPVIQLMSVADTMADQLLTSHTIHTRPNSTPKTPQEVSKVFFFSFTITGGRDS